MTDRGHPLPSLPSRPLIVDEIDELAATNRFDMLDPAILRPGRFDRLIEVTNPTEPAREQIFRIHTRSMNTDESVDYSLLAKETADLSGADIKSICTEAGMHAIRDDRTTVHMTDFLDAIEILELEGFDDEISKTFA